MQAPQATKLAIHIATGQIEDGGPKAEEQGKSRPPLSGAVTNSGIAFVDDQKKSGLPIAYG
jgi:hypothetical protein